MTRDQMRQKIARLRDQAALETDRTKSGELEAEADALQGIMDEDEEAEEFADLEADMAAEYDEDVEDEPW